MLSKLAVRSFRRHGVLSPRDRWTGSGQSVSRGPEDPAAYAGSFRDQPTTSGVPAQGQAQLRVLRAGGRWHRV